MLCVHVVCLLINNYDEILNRTNDDVSEEEVKGEASDGK